MLSAYLKGFILLMVCLPALASENIDTEKNTSGKETSKFSVKIGALNGSGYGSGSWQINSLENNTSSYKIKITDSSTVKTSLSSTSVTADIEITYDSAKDSYSGTSTPRSCSGTCDGVVIGDPTAIANIAVNLDENNMGTVTHTLDRPSPIGPATTTATYTLSAFGKAYLANSLTDTISIYDTGSSQIEKSGIPLKSSSMTKAVGDIDRQLIYVADSDGQSVNVFSTKTNAAVATIPVNGNPEDVLLSDDNRTLFASLKDKGTIATIDTDARRVTGEFTVNGSPTRMMKIPNGNSALVIDESTGGVTRFNLANQSVESVYSFESAVANVAASQEINSFYATLPASGALIIVDMDSGTEKTISGMTTPFQLVATSPTLAYVSSQGDPSLYVVDINAENVTQTISLPGTVTSIAPTTDNTSLFVTVESGGNAKLIEVDTRENKLKGETHELIGTGFTADYLAPKPNVGQLRLWNNAWVNIYGTCGSEAEFFLTLALRHTCTPGIDTLNVKADGLGTNNYGVFYPQQDCPFRVVIVNGTVFETWLTYTCDSE